MEAIAQILEKILHIQTEEERAAVLLPPMRDVFEASVCRVEGMTVLFARPRTGMTFTALQKQWKLLCGQTENPCVLVLPGTSRYAKERLIALGIPFIQGEDNLYLPFLGVALRKKRAGRLPAVTKLTPAAQKMVLFAIYENWRERSAREISERMGVSRMTASRSLLELQALGLPLVEEKKGAKYFVFSGGRRQLFDLCAPYLDNPVARTYLLEEIPHGLTCLGGRSALARYSPMADKPYLTYAVTREECRALHISGDSLCTPEEAACAVQVLRYRIDERNVIDPISAVLCVLENERCTPREEAAMKKMLQDFLQRSGTNS